MGVEQTIISTKIGEGHILADLLRKYATRSANTWQIIGYRVKATSANFGIEGGLQSYLGFLDGKLETISAEASAPGTVKQIDLSLNGHCYEGGGFRVQGLNPGFGKEITVYIMFSNGHYSAQQNLEHLKAGFDGGLDNIFAVASSHSTVTTFRYNVKPLDSQHESVIIESDEGVVTRAYRSVLGALQGLNIDRVS